MKTVTIPTIGSDPYKITINGYTYSYKAGSTVSVPDEVAAAIENAVRLFPAEVPPVDGSVFTLDGNAGTWDVAKGVDSAPAQGSEFTVTSGGVWQAIEDAKVTDEQLKSATEDVLEDHPEWTTTVEDGSITAAKLASGVIDDTLAVSGAAADAKVAGDAIDDLKTQLEAVEEYESITATYGKGLFNSSVIQYWLASGNYVASIPCSPGATYRIKKDISTARFSIAYITTTPAANVPVYGYKDENVSTSEVIYVVGANATYLLVCTGTTAPASHVTFEQASVKGIEELKTDIASIDGDVTALDDKVDDVLDSFDITEETWSESENISTSFTSGYMSQSGAVQQSDNLQYSEKIICNEGDIFKFSNTGTYNYFRFVTAFDANDDVLSDKGSETISNYTVPNGVASIVVTVPNQYTDNIVMVRSISGYVATRKPYGTFTVKGSLSDGEQLSVVSVNANKNVCQAFSADITTFSAISFGRKSSATVGYWITIDDTNVTVWRDNESATPVAHGLTIENNIQIRLKTRNTDPDDYTYADIVITSNGASFDLSNVYWVRSYGWPFVSSNGSELTNCALSWSAMDIGKTVFAFGDSYFSYMSARWVYYLAKDGYADNVLTSAFAGETSAASIGSLLNLVSAGEPKYVFWCLGMNDGSDDGAPSPGWAAGRDEVLNICSKYGITPVFATIPTVPTINHEYKNAWIRNSGYKYVDFAKAVGATASGEWYSGMLSNDGVHPTTEGAKALYGRVLTDFPEITISN